MHCDACRMSCTFLQYLCKSIEWPVSPLWGFLGFTFFGLPSGGWGVNPSTRVDERSETGCALLWGISSLECFVASDYIATRHRGVLGEILSITLSSNHIVAESSTSTTSQGVSKTKARGFQNQNERGFVKASLPLTVREGFALF